MKTNPNDPVGFVDGGDGIRVPMGLTKREYFAAMAMQGQIAHYGAANPESAAKMAVKASDALIAELNETSTSKQ